jgi:hypothetical protein
MVNIELLSTSQVLEQFQGGGSVSKRQVLCALRPAAASRISLLWLSTALRKKHHKFVLRHKPSY